MLTARVGRCVPGFGSMDRAMEEMFDSFVRGGFGGVRRGVFPAINAWETSDAIVVEAELPGYAIEDVDISMLGHELTVSGGRGETLPEGATMHRRERPAGRFSRTVRIAGDVEAERVSAALKNGVLTVTLPKAQAVKPRKIEVTGR